MGFLAEIVAEHRAVIERPEYLEGLPARPPPPRPSLRAAVTSRSEVGALLIEYKRASPGNPGPELPRRTLTEFLRAAASPDVAGFSCLATAPRFGGRPLDVYDLARISDRPVLFKDFVVGERQLDAAVRAGASSVLLIARLATMGLLERPLPDLAAAAHRRGLEVLLELHAEAELSEAEGVEADMYGVNVRDLDTLRFERPTAERTVRAALTAGRRPFLGMSGVETGEDARRFWSLGVDGLLVGTAIARSDRPAELIPSLLRPGRGGAP